MDGPVHRETVSRTSLRRQFHGTVHRETVSLISSQGDNFTHKFTGRQFYGQVHRRMFHGQFKETVSRARTHGDKRQFRGPVHGDQSIFVLTISRHSLAIFATFPKIFSQDTRTPIL